MSMAEFDPATTGRRVREQREARGLGVRELARQTGLHHKAIQTIEGGGGITLHSLVLICKALHQSPNDLIGWQDTGGENIRHHS